MRGARVLLATAAIALLASSARADDPEVRWAVTIWGLSYHVNQSIDYDERNWGAGLRYYLGRHVFVEGDALRNSNRGLVLPASVGVEIGMGSIGRCSTSAVGALTVAYYQNLRTASSYVKFGPVPGIAVRCGRWQPNVIAVLSPSRDLLAAIVASLTIHF